MKILIKEKRSEAKLSQNALAVMCDWEQGRISHYETGRRAPGLDDLERIATALNITVHDLIDVGQEKNSKVQENSAGYSAGLSAKDAELIRLYQSSRPKIQKAILAILEAEADIAKRTVPAPPKDKISTEVESSRRSR